MMADGSPHTEAERQKHLNCVGAIAAEVRAHVPASVTSDHDWLHGEDDLPVGGNEFCQTDIVPALKD